MEEHLYIVTYDISDHKRWRTLFQLMNGYGEWIQLSVFQCRLSQRRRAELIAAIDTYIHHEDDHVIILDLGPADTVRLKVVSLGKGFQPVDRKPIIV